MRKSHQQLNESIKKLSHSTEALTKEMRKLQQEKKLSCQGSLLYKEQKKLDRLLKEAKTQEQKIIKKSQKVAKQSMGCQKSESFSYVRNQASF